MTDRYARVYFDRMARDDKFSGIMSDHAVMGSWLILLIEAEKAWPAPAFPPPPSWVPPEHLRLLVDLQIVDEEKDGRYRFHGLDRERGVRSERGKDAAEKRWSIARSNADGNATSNAPGNASAFHPEMPNAHARVVSSSAVSPSLEGGAGGVDDGRADLEAWLVVKFREPSPKQRDFLNAYCRVFDATGPERAAQLIYRHPDDPIAALKSDLDAFRKERAAEAAAQERPKPVRRKGSGMSGINAELSKLLGVQYAHQNGEHPEPVTGCPYCQEGAA